ICSWSWQPAAIVDNASKRANLDRNDMLLSWDQGATRQPYGRSGLMLRVINGASSAKRGLRQEMRRLGVLRDLRKAPTHLIIVPPGGKSTYAGDARHRSTLSH